MSVASPHALVASLGWPSAHRSPTAFGVRAHASPELGWFGEDLWNAVTHPADTVSGAWDILTHPGRSASDFADAATKVLHTVPGMDWVGEQLKDFARTSFGASMLQIVSTFCYYAAAPYVGAQTAAIAFALPGVARKEQFYAAWTKEFVNRVMQTISWFLANKVDLKQVGDLASAETQKLLSDNPVFQQLLADLSSQASHCAVFLKGKLGDELSQRIEQGVSGAAEEAAASLAAKFGMPPNFDAIAAQAGTRADMSALAFDLLAGTNYAGSVSWDARTGRDAAVLRQESLRAVKQQTVQQALATSMYAHTAAGRAMRAADELKAATTSQTAQSSIARGATFRGVASGVASAPASSFLQPVTFARPSVAMPLVSSAMSTSTKAIAVGGGVAGLALLAWVLL